MARTIAAPRPEHADHLKAQSACQKLILPTIPLVASLPPLPPEPPAAASPSSLTPNSPSPLIPRAAGASRFAAAFTTSGRGTAPRESRQLGVPVAGPSHLRRWTTT